ncbi:unnamed protein product [Mytilus coruscus]|uniref:B box-type domain-containing protein n=1 Tax=Mytilus coruscus TaxID=42192 RepID=A0A6J8B037_MYTCO|nr:unnamed protein product [Mytilus coruscus]
METPKIPTSIRKAQVPVSCYFCKGQEIKWKCQDCNIRMCNSCKITIHQGLQSVQDHDVIFIQDIGSSPCSQEVTSVVISSVFNSYTTTIPAVHTLLSSDDDLLYFTFCLSPSYENQFVKGKLLKSSIKILQTLKRRIFCTAINKDGKILLKNFDDNTIQILSPAGGVKTVLDTSPMMLLAIHVNKDNEVIVGLRELGPPFPVLDFSVRQIIIFDSDYQRKVTLEFDKKGDKLFSYAFCIRTDSKNVIYVVDVLDNKDSGRIVAVDRNGRIRFTYDGQKDLETFKPQGITVTPSDNIVVADYSNDALHVINSKGDLLGLQFIFKDLGITEPFSLCFDSGGYLLIGCGRGKNGDYGKIHVVKMADSLM